MTTVGRQRGPWLLWVALTVVFGGVGYRQLVHEAAHLPTMATGRDATSDTWLQVLEIPHPAAAVRAALADLPDDAALVVVASPDSVPKLTSMVITMLAWPHQVGFVLCNDDGTASPEIMPAGHVSAVLQYRHGDAYEHMAVGTTPTVRVGDSDLPSVGIGPALQLIHGTDTTAWPSYCSL